MGRLELWTLAALPAGYGGVVYKLRGIAWPFARGVFACGAQAFGIARFFQLLADCATSFFVPSGERLCVVYTYRARIFPLIAERVLLFAKDVFPQ